MEKEVVVEKIFSKSNDIVLKVNGFLTHSMYNPKSEAEKFARNHWKDCHVHILYGYGSGYIVEELLKIIDDNAKLIIIEPFLEVPNLQYPNVKIIKSNDINTIKMHIYNSFDLNHNINVIVSLNYDKIDLDLYKDFLQVVNEKLKLEKINENTAIMMSKQWHHNYLKNLNNIPIDESLYSLKFSFNYPVVIASGGPSLTKQLSILKKYRNNIILVSAGSTINSLLANNIEPDYVVSIDGHLANFNHFKNLVLEHSKFVYSMYSFPEIRNSFIQKGYYFLSKNAIHLSTHLKQFSKENIIILDGGGSVAQFALSFANFITSGPIALIGQDLAYTNNETHASNNKQYKKIDISSIKENRRYIEIDGYYGDKVISDHSFLAMKIGFEKLIKGKSDNKYYNCTEGGTYLEGYNHIPFKEFCENYASTPIKIEYNEKSNDTLKKQHIIKELNRNLEIYKKIISYIDKNVRLLKSNVSNVEFNNNILKQLDNNDKKIEGLIKITSLNTALDPLKLAINKKYIAKSIDEIREDKYQRIYNQNIDLYFGMKEITIESEKIIKSILNGSFEGEHLL